jgi:hypothetical protein
MAARWVALAAILLALLASAAPAGAATRHHSPFAGLGTWLDIYSPEWNNPEAAVSAMAQHRVKTLYLETGNYSHKDSVYRPDMAGRFIDAAHAAGIKIVAWYLPAFLNVKIDARKALGAIRFRSTNGHRFSGFALDVEATKVKSLTLRDHRLLMLSSKLHLSVPRRYPLGAITPSPVGMSPYYWPDIPYSDLTRYYKAFLPMAYSTMREIHTRAGTRDFMASTVTSIRDASGDPSFPIHIIGGLANSMGAAETAGFLKAVAMTKPAGYSLYTFGLTTPATWRAIERQH